jgi:AsmA protein
MTSSKRKVLLAIGIIVGGLMFAAIALPFLVDVNRFRPMIESEARSATGREVKIGNLDLSLLRGGVVAHDISAADDRAFSRDPFVTAKSLTIGVEIWPLVLSREIKVTSVTLREPQINLIRAASGRWNFSSLGAPATANKSTTPSSTPEISVDKLRVENGRVTITQAGQKHTYSDVNVQVKNFSAKSEFPFEIAANTPGGGSLKLDGEAGPLAAGDIAQTPMTAEVSIKELNLAKSGFIAADSGIAGIVDYRGKVRSNGKTLHSEGKMTATQLKVVKGGVPAKQPVILDYAANMAVRERKGALTRGDILIGQSRAKLLGTFDSSGKNIALNARLRGDAMPVDSLAGLLPAVGVILPQGSQVQGGTASTDLLLQGPIDQLVITGPINIANTKVSGFNLKSRASGLTALAGMPSASDLIIQALNSRLRVAPEGIRAEGIQLVVPSIGSVSGNGSIGNNNALDFKMRAKLEGGGGLMGGVSAISTLGQSKGELPFLIQGTTSNPVFLPDVAGAVAGSLKSPVQTVEGVSGMFGGLFGKKKKQE